MKDIFEISNGIEILANDIKIDNWSVNVLQLIKN